MKNSLISQYFARGNASYRIAIILPLKGKALLLDDKRYFLSFDNQKNAVFTLPILNSSKVNSSLKSITSSDSKRIITKEVVGGIDTGSK
ncbi:MAG: hypothetical protein RML10_12940 [Geminocystis sp.]|nr:hypothetical protein [Geminocystis sp.]